MEKGTQPQEFKHRLRLAGVIIDGNLDLERALMKIKGIGHRVARSLIYALDLDPKRKIGTFSDEEIEELEKSIENINKILPAWMLNRKRDPYSGEDLHLIGPDLDIAIKEDIALLKRIKCYRGIRHAMGLPVRGQRTRTSFRKGETVGVTKRRKK